MTLSIVTQPHQQVLFHAESDTLAAQWRAAFSDLAVTSGCSTVVEDKTLAAEQSLLLLHLHASETRLLTIRHLIECGFDVVVISEECSTAEGIELFQCGVKGYLSCDFPLSDYPRVISTVLQGNVWLGQKIMGALIKNMQPLEAPVNDWQQGLTNREIQVAEAIMEGKSNRTIAEQLFITDRTVKAHVHSLLTKFGAKDRLSLVLKIQAIRHPSR